MRETNVLDTPFEIDITSAVKLEICRERYYFSFLFVLEGNGTHCVKENSFSYKPGDFLILGPQHKHSFKPESISKFCFIRFNRAFFSSELEKDVMNTFEDWFKKLEFIFNNHAYAHDCILQNENDKKLTHCLIEGLIIEYQNKTLYHENILKSTLYALLTVIARNIALAQLQSFTINSKDKTDLFFDLFNYIQLNIYYPEKLSTHHLSEKFNLSANYVGEFFKKHTGQTLREYIIKYKLKLVESKLVYSNKSISEIAFEFGFTDESHLSKTFKKIYQTTPKKYRFDKKEEFL